MDTNKERPNIVYLAIIISIIAILSIALCLPVRAGEKIITNQVLLTWDKSEADDIDVYNIYVDSSYISLVNHPDTSIVIQFDTLSRYYRTVNFNVTSEDTSDNESIFSNTEKKLMCRDRDKLYCDIDSDNKVINIDYYIFIRKLGMEVAIDDTLLQNYDFNGDGYIDNIDFSILLRQLGNRK